MLRTVLAPRRVAATLARASTLRAAARTAPATAQLPLRRGLAADAKAQANKGKSKPNANANANAKAGAKEEAPAHDIKEGTAGQRFASGLGRALGWAAGAAVVVTAVWNGYRWVTGEFGSSSDASDSDLTAATNMFNASWGLVRADREVLSRLGQPLSLQGGDPSIPPSGGNSRRAPRQPYFYRRNGDRTSLEYLVAGQRGAAIVFAEVAKEKGREPFFVYLCVKYQTAQPTAPTFIVDIRTVAPAGTGATDSAGGAAPYHSSAAAGLVPKSKRDKAAAAAAPAATAAAAVAPAAAVPVAKA